MSDTERARLPVHFVLLECISLTIDLEYTTDESTVSVLYKYLIYYQHQKIKEIKKKRMH